MRVSKADSRTIVEEVPAPGSPTTRRKNWRSWWDGILFEKLAWTPETFNGPQEGVAWGLEAVRDRPDSANLLPEIHVPVLVLVGEEDTLTPVAQSRIIAESIPGAGLEVIPAAGHLSNLEAEGAFNRALRAFMEK